MKVNKTKKYTDGGAIATAGVQAGLGLYQGIQGIIQSNRARKQLDELNKNRPNVGVPSAYEELANEPIAEQFMRAQKEQRVARTAQAANTLGKGGARTLLGGIGSVLNDERRNENSQTALYEQARKDALGALGGAQERKIGREQDIWNTQVMGAQVSEQSGSLNKFGGASGMGRGLAFLFEQDDAEKAKNGSKLNHETQTTPSEYSHDGNPLVLTDKNGIPAIDKNDNKKIELEGDETIINKEQRKKISTLKGGKLESFIKNLFNGKKFKR